MMIIFIANQAADNLPTHDENNSDDYTSHYPITIATNGCANAASYEQKLSTTWR
jgi:hypothetical protein